MIVSFLVPNVVLAQDLDFSQIAKNTEEAKKKNKERRKKQKPTGLIISVGFGSFDKSYDELLDMPSESYDWQLGETLLNGYEDRVYESYSSNEVNIRIHYLFKKINLGVYISPIVSNTTEREINSIYRLWDQYGYADNYTGQYVLVDNSQTLFEEIYEYESYAPSLGSIQFGVSTTVFNTLTLSAGSSIGLDEVQPITKLNIGTMFHLGRMNLEYRFSVLNTGISFSDLNPTFHMLSYGYRFSTSK